MNCLCTFVGLSAKYKIMFVCAAWRQSCRVIALKSQLQLRMNAGVIGLDVVNILRNKIRMHGDLLLIQQF